jgi:4-diphosphocytidyl-2-C-methyl-D-erythritol kinase
MVSFPPCKINLGLHIVGKRTDGYHDIETCFYPVPWTDILEVVPARDFSFSVSGNPVPGPAADNLCARAYELLRKQFNLKPVAIHLHKLLPIGAGLGGGSANGAYTLKAVCEIFNLPVTAGQMQAYAAQLGSDCAFFIENKPVIGTGRGELLAEVAVSLKNKYLIIVQPEVHVSTSTAYAGVTPRKPAVDLREVVEQHRVDRWRQILKNDFEDHLFKQFPIIEALQQKLYAFGALYASMSGSGSAVFGIFREAVDLKKEFETFTYWSGYLD